MVLASCLVSRSAGKGCRQFGQPCLAGSFRRVKAFRLRVMPADVGIQGARTKSECRLSERFYRYGPEVSSHQFEKKVKKIKNTCPLLPENFD
jgi:hypothetical protein